MSKLETSNTRRGGLVGPVILIGIGIFFLLTNLGLLNWNFWEAATRLWPIVLIALGLDLLIGRRSLLGSLLVVVATVILLATGLFWLNLGGGQGELISGEVSQPLDGATSAQVEIAFGVGRLQLHTLPPDTPLLIAGELIHDERSSLRAEEHFEMRGSVAHYALTSRGSSNSFPFGSQSQDTRWNLMLNRDVPLDLTVRTGVGQSDLDLSLLKLTDLSINTGVGETTVIMPGSGEVNGVINGGVGELIIQIPDGMAARIDVKTGLGNSQIAGEFERNGDVYMSPGYETAVDRLNLELRAGIGQVTVRRMTGR
jgi:hypothetical protein